MSIDPSYATDAQPTTDIAARGRPDPWAAPDETPSSPIAARSPRQFEPSCRRRLRNLMDEENAYCE